MREHSPGLIAIVVLCLASAAFAQVETTAETLSISATDASTWTNQGTTIIQLDGAVSIDLDQTHLTSRRAVVWITPVPHSIANLQRLEIVLLDEAAITDPNATQTGRWFYVDASLRGLVRLTARRSGVDRSESATYKEAASHRPAALTSGPPSGQHILTEEGPPVIPSTRPAAEFRPLKTVQIDAREMHSEKMADGRTAMVIPGKVTLMARMERGDLLELMADRAVVFTPYASFVEVGAGSGGKTGIAATGAYLEGDVRILRTPRDQSQPEQSVTCNRAFYDFTTDRAVMTDVVLHTSDPKSDVPMTVRAQLVRQLSENEYTAERGRISTSSFRTPSYSIGARSTYIRQTDINDPVTGTRTAFVAHDATLDVQNLPIFYLPVLVGDFTEHSVFRNFAITSRHAFGVGLTTEWGLFETFERLPPKGTDATYFIDYFSKRGPGIGLNGHYIGGVADPATLEPWSYSGDFKSYLVLDSGIDDLGRERVNVSPESDLRGRFWWHHQHFLPGDWQVQLTGAYISDPTFLEQWFNPEFRDFAPIQDSIYAKHQTGSEAYTFLVSAQLNDFATVADAYQEQAEVQRLPEVSYRRIGDSLLGDSATFFSANTLSALQFKDSREGLGELGFLPTPVGFQSPGLPSYGWPTQQLARAKGALPEDPTYRGDFREELDFPFAMYQFRMVPYVVGRYTDYSESVDGSTRERVMGAAGLRMTTAFWKVDDTVESNFFDLHRLRHVIEPELNVYASAQSTDRDKLLIYDEPIDAVTDIAAVQLALNQRWQTKRGGPGQWRSVDVFSWNVQGNFFFNQPPDNELDPRDFRGLYYASMPEASVPRNSINSQISWRISDSVQILQDVYYNLDENMLAAASIGAAVKHDPRLSYYVGLRHVGINMNQVVYQNGQANTFEFDREDLIRLAAEYQLTAKYQLTFSEAYDVAQNRQNSATLNFIRHLDRLYVSVGFRLDAFQSGGTGVFFNIWPEGMKPGTTTSSTLSGGGF